MIGRIRTTALCLVSLAAGFFFGNIIGKDNGYKAHAALQRSRSMTELRADLKETERAHILDLLDVTAEVKRVDEGGLFKTKFVTYLHAKITNSASVATVKDVKLRIDFFSKTDSPIGSNELTVYEFIPPNGEHSWKQKITWPADAERYKLILVTAKIN